MIYMMQKIRALENLDAGCSKHKDYRARRAPKVECERCASMWQSRLLLKEIGKEIPDVPVRKRASKKK